MSFFFISGFLDQIGGTIDLQSDAVNSVRVQINGIDAIVSYNASTTVAAGEVYITDNVSGFLYFSSSDNGQPYQIDYDYLRKVDSTEIL